MDVYVCERAPSSGPFTLVPGYRGPNVITECPWCHRPLAEHRQPGSIESGYALTSQSTTTEWRTDGTTRFYDDGKLTRVIGGHWWKRWALRTRILARR